LTTPAQAARELLRRERAAESLVDYARAIDIPGAPVSEDPESDFFLPLETQMAAHHILLLTELQRCIETPFGRLIIMAPPGSAKSIYAGAVATTWAMGKIPGFKIVSTSYAGAPAMRSARRAQLICKSAAYQAIWDGKVVPIKGSQGIEEWSLSNGSTMLSAGLMGGITSSRADFGLVDDPVAGREEADSPQQQVKTKQAYDDDFMTRLKPAASICIIMTRWNESDLVGSILPADYAGQSGDVLCRDGQIWRVVRLPAECDSIDDPLGRKLGEMLWPEWFSDRHWSIYRNNHRTWTCLYQQAPAPESGGQFEKNDFKRYDTAPAECRWYLSCDFALSDGTVSDNPDRTELGAFGVTHDALVYCEDGVGGMVSPDISIGWCVAYSKRFKPVELLLESGGIFNALSGQIVRELMSAGAYTTLQKMPSWQDKIAKVAAFRAKTKMGQIYVKNGSWGDKFIATLCAFPGGRYKDMVDMAGQIGRRIEEMYAPKPPPIEAKPKKVTPLSTEALEWADREDEDAEERRRKFML
jgi:hypothetical protein